MNNNQATGAVNIDELSAHLGNYIGKLIMENFLLRQQINELASALSQQMQQNGQGPQEEEKTKAKQPGVK